jgi:endoglycosylceramidase
MYDRISAAIRQVDEKNLIFFEGTTWSDFGAGFKSVPGGQNYRNRTVLSYHHYIPPNLSINQTFSARMSDLQRLGCGGMLTEFDSSENKEIWNGTMSMMDACNKHKQSWIGWEYKPFVTITGYSWGLIGPDGSLNVQLARILSQTYAQRVAGVVKSQHFDFSKPDYMLVYDVNEKCKLPTVIYLNEELHYPNGIFVTVVNGNWRRVAKNYIHVQASGKGEVIVRIRKQ